MDIFKILKQRYTCRGYLDKKIPKQDLQKILTYALKSPSGVNSQPVYIACVSREIQSKISQKIINKLNEGIKEQMDYQYYPKTWIEPYASRRFEVGMGLYTHLGIQRNDKQKRKEQWEKNYKAFNASNIMYVFIDKRMMSGFMIDAGIFIANIVSCATALGINTSILGALAEYPNVVKNELKISDDKALLCGIALGYADSDDIANTFRTNRANINDICDFFE